MSDNEMTGGEAIARIVENPDTARALTPSHPFACKRPIIDQGYFETYNRDSVTLVDLRENPIISVTPEGGQATDLPVQVDAGSRYPPFVATGPFQRTGMLPSANKPRTGEFWFAAVTPFSSSALRTI